MWKFNKPSRHRDTPRHTSLSSHGNHEIKKEISGALSGRSIESIRTHIRMAEEKNIPVWCGLSEVFGDGYYRYINFLKVKEEKGKEEKEGKEEKVPLYCYDDVDKIAYYVVGESNNDKFKPIIRYYCIDSNWKIIADSDKRIFRLSLDENRKIVCHYDISSYKKSQELNMPELKQKISELIFQAKQEERNGKNEWIMKHKYGEVLKIYEKNNQLIQEDSEKFLKVLSEYLGINADDTDGVQLNFYYLCLEALKIYEKDNEVIRNENNSVGFLRTLSKYISIIGNGDPSEINLGSLCLEALKIFNKNEYSRKKRSRNEQFILNNRIHFLRILSKYLANNSMIEDDPDKELILRMCKYAHENFYWEISNHTSPYSNILITYNYYLKYSSVFFTNSKWI